MWPNLLKKLLMENFIFLQCILLVCEGLRNAKLVHQPPQILKIKKWKTISKIEYFYATKA